MDLFDVAPPPDVPTRTKKTFGEEVVTLLGMIVFPGVSLFAPGVLGDSGLSVALLPVLCAGATLALAIRVRARTSVTLLSTLFCAAASFLAAAVGSAFATF